MDTGNTIHTIHHVESLRRKASYYWPDKFYHSYVRGAISNANNHDFRPALNLHTLITALSRKERTTIDDDSEDQSPDGNASSSDSILRKRKCSGLVPIAKRIRLDHGAQTNSSDEWSESGETGEDVVGREHRQTYPSFWESPSDIINEAHETVHTSFHQVYQFALHLRYNKSIGDGSEHYADDKAAAKWGWLEEEKKLYSLLEARQKNVSLSRDIVMGKIYLTRYHGHLLALSGQLQKPPASFPEEYSGKWSFLLPDIPWPDGLSGDNLEKQDMQPSGIHHDFITACAVLQSHHRARLQASLQLHVLPEGTYDATSDLPFELRVHFVLSLATPEIYYPFKNSLPQRTVDELEGLQRRLICFLSNKSLTRSAYNNAMEDPVDVTIPFFLKIMRPAPPLPQGVIYESLQPDGLLATLMPFQRRTVAWMLEREGKWMTPVGTVAPLDSEASSTTESKSLPLFWEEVEMGGRRFFFNRLASSLSPTLPKVHTALGGMLAEEPGPPSFSSLYWIAYKA